MATCSYTWNYTDSTDTMTLTYSVSTTNTNITITATKLTIKCTKKSGTATYTQWPSGAMNVNIYNGSKDLGVALSIPFSAFKYTYGEGVKTLWSGTKSKTINKEHYSMVLKFNHSTNMYTIPAKASYTITFNPNSGTGGPSTQTKWYGETLKISTSKPTRTGYSFVKWNTKSDGTGTSYNPDGNYTANAAATLYAIWKANTYTVSYDANGGTGAPTNQTKTYGTALTLSNITPSRNGYSFLNWNTNKSGTGTSYNPGASYTTNADLDLFAIWQQYFFPPTITNLTATRAIFDETSQTYIEEDEGNIGHVKFNWAPGTDGTQSINPTSCYIGIKEEEDAGDYNEIEVPITNNVITAYIDLIELDIDKAYSIRIRFEVDDWTDVISYTFIAKAWYVMDVNQELTAIGFGQNAPDGVRGIFFNLPTFFLLSNEFNSPSYFNDEVHLGRYKRISARDNQNVEYPAIYDNGVNLWIGAQATSARHHSGGLYLSSGHDGTNGNKSIYVSVPNANNDGASNHHVLHTGYSPTTPTISISNSTGTLAANFFRVYGKVVHFVLTVKNSSAVANGSNIYVGRLNTTNMRPIITARGTGYLGGNAYVGLIASDGSIIVRNTGSSLAANTEVTIAGTYLTN